MRCVGGSSDGGKNEGEAFSEGGSDVPGRFDGGGGRFDGGGGRFDPGGRFDGGGGRFDPGGRLEGGGGRFDPEAADRLPALRRGGGFGAIVIYGTSHQLGGL
jgi:hypothetical protein